MIILNVVTSYSGVPGKVLSFVGDMGSATQLEETAERVFKNLIYEEEKGMLPENFLNVPPVTWEYDNGKGFYIYIVQSDQIIKVN